MIDNRAALAQTDARELALDCVAAGIAAGDPMTVLAEEVAADGDRVEIGEATYDLGTVEEVIVVGGGKATARQATALVDLLGDRIDHGAVVAPAEERTAGPIEILPGDHPVPSGRSVQSTARMRELLAGAGDRTLVIGLISGGGSALLTAPAGEISLADLRSLTDALLESGATIAEINAVRKHLSAIKGGGLARTAAPARLAGVIMSDVVGDELSVIASGPTVPDPTSFADAQAVLERYDIAMPAAVARRLDRGQSGDIAETPTPGDPLFERVENQLVADGGTAVRAAERLLAERAERPVRLSTRIRGEAREAAKTQVAIAEEIRASGQPVAPPAVLLSGGETTVTVRGDGVGGPNLEFALSAALEVGAGVTVAAVDTDGIDGAATAAGAVVDQTTVETRAQAIAALETNDAGPYLEGAGETILTSATGTNVNDLRVVVVESAAER